MIDRPMRPYLFRAQAVLLTLAFGLLAQFLCVADSYGQTQRPRKVAVQLKWKHQFQFAGIYAAKAKGFYRDAGLDVSVLEGGPELDPVALVMSGAAEFGIGNSTLLVDRAKGLPLVVVAPFFQHSPFVIIAIRKPDLETVRDIEGHTLMVESHAAEDIAYLLRSGVSMEKVATVPHTGSAHDLGKDGISAMTAYSTTEPFDLIQAGIPYQIWSPREIGIDFYGDTLFTTERFAKDNPEVVRAFRDATIKGWQYALKHTGEIIDLIIKDYAPTMNRRKLEFEAEETKRLMITDIVDIGYNSPKRWAHIAEVFAAAGMMPEDFRLDNFIFDDPAKNNLRWLYWSVIALSVLAVAAFGWVIPLLRLNEKLRKEIVVRKERESELVRAKEEADAANSAKSRYLAIMSHEIRTPLSGIIGIVGLLRDGPQTPAQREYLELVDESSGNLLQLLTRLLDWSRIEGGGGEELEIARVDLPELVESLCALFRPAAEAKRLVLSSEIAPGVPTVILSDEMRLRQILSNLLSNAVKFTEHGGIRVSVSADPVTESGQVRLKFLVADTGEGIPESAMSRVFVPYAQGDPSVARLHGGTGLGLPISLELAKLLGGGITIESRPGKGSVFKVEILTKPA